MGHHDNADYATYDDAMQLEPRAAVMADGDNDNMAALPQQP